MRNVLTDKELSTFFKVSPEYDSGTDADWKDFFANAHFRVTRERVELVFSYSHNFGDLQVMVSVDQDVIFCVAIMNPVDIRLTERLCVFIGNQSIVQISIDQKIRVEIVSHGNPVDNDKQD